MGLMSLGEGCIEMQRDTGTQRGEGHRKTGAEMGAIPLQAEAEGHGSLQGLLERLDSPSQCEHNVYVHPYTCVHTHTGY